MTVEFADAEPNGLADLVGRLIGANLEEDPGRRALLAPCFNHSTLALASVPSVR